MPFQRTNYTLLYLCDQLKFLAVDGGGLARLHSFNNDSWRLDCTFRLLPSAVSAEYITGRLYFAFK